MFHFCIVAYDEIYMVDALDTVFVHIDDIFEEVYN